MQRIWTVVLSVWAMLAIVTVLAWTNRPLGTPTAAGTPNTVVVQGANGKRQLVLVQPTATAAPHATTSTSHVGG